MRTRYQQQQEEEEEKEKEIDSGYYRTEWDVVQMVVYYLLLVWSM
jgi:hypothetical protein